jgi:dolichol-phosphate mannosyltransferase
MKLSIIIPSYNEVKTLPNLLTKLNKLDLTALNFQKEIILVDDGSTDDTNKIVKNFPFVNYIYQKNSGKGNAVINGIKNSTGDYVIVQDADLEYNVDDYELLLSKISLNNLNVIYGNRYYGIKFFTGYKNQKFTSILANIYLSIFIFFLFGRFISDSLTGYKIYPRDLILSFNTQTKGFETDHEHTAKIIRLGIDITEVPISFSPRKVSDGKKIKGKDFFKAIVTYLKFRFISCDKF